MTKGSDHDQMVDYGLEIKAAIVPWLKIMALFISTFLFVWYLDTAVLPSTIPETAPDHQFSEDRARFDATYLSDEIGKRLVGSKMTVAAGKYIHKRLLEIQNDAIKNHAAHPDFPSMEISVQNATGGQVFSLFDASFTNSYTNLTNIVVRVASSEKSKQYSLLINSHFDTTIGTQGAADDSVPVGVMMELINNLLHTKSLPYAVVFLFNGAEETLQEGSHAFITQHPWAKTCRFVLNLEACGTGGPELLFQVGSLESARIYVNAAPHPTGSSLASDIFRTGLIQSDTDYRVFVQYSDIVGLDMAFYRNSYVYHTDRDVMNLIEAGSVQHMGDNSLAIIFEVMRSNILEHPEHAREKNQPVFFDVLGLYMVFYSIDAATMMHVGFILTVLLFALPFKLFVPAKIVLTDGFIAPVRNAMGTVLVSYLFAIFSTLSFAASVAFLLKEPLRWFTVPHSVFVLYGAQSVGALLALDGVIHMRSVRFRTTIDKEWLAFLGYFWMTVMLLALLTIAKVPSSFFIFLYSLFGSIAVAYVVFKSVLTGSKDYQMDMIAYIIAFVPPSLQMFRSLIGVVDVFCPLTGRMPYFVPTELIVAGATAIFFTFPALPLLSFGRRHEISVLIGSALAGLAVGVFICLMIGFPVYDYWHPKRIFIQHTHVINSNDKEFEKWDHSYLLISRSDARPLQPYLARYTPEIVDYEPYHEKIQFLWDAVYPASVILEGIKVDVEPVPPPLHAPTLSLISDRYDATTDSRHMSLMFNYTGHEWSTLRFQRPLKSWSLTKDLPPDEDGYYVVRHIGSHGTNRWNLTLEVQGKQPVEFNITATHFIGSPAIERVKKEFPNWVQFTELISVLSCWTL